MRLKSRTSRQYAWKYTVLSAALILPMSAWAPNEIPTGKSSKLKTPLDHFQFQPPRIPYLKDVDQGRLHRLLGRYADVEIAPPIDAIQRLDDSELITLRYLVQASEIMDEVYRLQQDPGVDRFVKDALASGDPELIKFVHHMGSYAEPHGGDPTELDRGSIIPGLHPSDGRNMYPAGSAKVGTVGNIPEIIKAQSQGAETEPEGLAIKALLENRQTFVRKTSDGKLVAIPYSLIFESQFRRSGRKLKLAAISIKHKWPKFAAFLEAKAAAFKSNNYAESDRLWMLIEPDCPFDIVIGPTESYEDKILGIREQATGYVLINDSKIRDRFKSIIDISEELDALLPIPNRDSVGKKSYDVTLIMGYEVYRAGDGRAGVQAIAYNLPNNADVRNEFGFKMTLLRNVIQAKGEAILKPLAHFVLEDKFATKVSNEAFSDFVFLHEHSHGLGPGTVKVGADRKEIRVQDRLGNHYHPIEELKADITGMYILIHLLRERPGEKLLPIDLETYLTTYVAGLFRSIRFGIEDAHGESNLLQIHYLERNGGLIYDESSKRYRIDIEKLITGIKNLTADVMKIEANVDPDSKKAQASAKHFLDTYDSKIVSPQLKALFDEAEKFGIPDDLRPHHPMAEALLKFKKSNDAGELRQTLCE
jgi:hypothetical protein